MSLIDTSAGQSINEELIRMRREYYQELEALKRDRAEAKAERMERLLAEEGKRVTQKLEEINKGQKDLAAGYEDMQAAKDEKMKQILQEIENQMDLVNR
jgi:hypothetical protein